MDRLGVIGDPLPPFRCTDLKHAPLLLQVADRPIDLRSL
jgi:hypothetical protein